MHYALFLVGKLACRQTIFGSAVNPIHATATAMHFPANAGLIFLTDELTNDRYFVDTGATLSIVPCSQNSRTSGPLLKRADGTLLKKLCNFKASFLHQLYCKPLWPVLFWALTILRKFKVTVSPEISQIQFACPPFCLQRPRPPPNIFSGLICPAFLFSSTPVQAPVLIPPPTATTSS